MRYISKIHVLLCAAALAITACQSEDSISPETDMETVKLLVTVPATSGLTRIGDPGTGVEEGADWDRLAVILAYKDGPYVQKTIITIDDFDKLPNYDGREGVKLLTIDAQIGSAYIYGVTYSSDALYNPEQSISDCKDNEQVKALTISNDYAGTDDNASAKFVSVATGYYKTAVSGDQPALFEIQVGGTGEIGSIPTMTLTRLASKIDIQWDAADAYDQGYTDVKVTDFTYKGKEYGRLFPEITGVTPDNQDKSWTFYNTSEISQRNGRVYHYTFTDGATTPSVTFNISARKDGNDITGSGYTMNFSYVLQQAAWYKVNATIKGVTGSGSITLSMN